MSPPPEVLPDVQLATLQGEVVALRDPSAVARLIVVYRHDCEACRTVLPVIERVSRAFHGQKLLTLGVSQSDEDGTLDTINEHGLCFPQALDAESVVSRALAVDLLPAVVLADAAGRIVARSAGVAREPLTSVLVEAAHRSGADEGEIRRAIAAFALPDEATGTAARPRA